MLAESQEGGKAWRNLRPQGLPAMDLHGYAAAGGLHVALEATHGYFVSEDGGQIFKPTAPKGLPKANMAAMVFQGRTLYVAPMGQGLYQSPDGGQTFTQVPTPEKEIYALAVGVGTFTWEADRPLAEDPGGLEKAVAGHGPGPRRPSPGGRKARLHRRPRAGLEASVRARPCRKPKDPEGYPQISFC